MSKTITLLLFATLTPLRAQDLAEVFAKVSPTVVTIHIVESRLTEKGGRPARGATIGSGVLLDTDGTVLTAAHVVELADEVVVEFSDGTRRAAAVVATEPGADLALVRLRDALPEGAVPCVLGDSDAMKIGNQVFVVGAPMGMDHTLTAGHVSAKRQDERFLGSMGGFEHLQTDAAINPGNSGGPLFNLSGEVVGIVCHITTSAAGSEGIGFAVTSNTARRLLIEHRRVWLGFDALPLPEELARALNVPDGHVGLLVMRVSKSSPTRRAGLRAGTIPAHIGGRDLVLGGDIVLGIQGRQFGSHDETAQAMAAVRELTPESTLRLTVLRGGAIIELTALIRE